MSSTFAVGKCVNELVVAGADTDQCTLAMKRRHPLTLGIAKIIQLHFPLKVKLNGVINFRGSPTTMISSEITTLAYNLHKEECKKNRVAPATFPENDWNVNSLKAFTLRFLRLLIPFKAELLRIKAEEDKKDNTATATTFSGGKKGSEFSSYLARGINDIENLVNSNLALGAPGFALLGLPPADRMAASTAPFLPVGAPAIQPDERVVGAVLGNGAVAPLEESIEVGIEEGIEEGLNEYGPEDAVAGNFTTPVANNKRKIADTRRLQGGGGASSASCRPRFGHGNSADERVKTGSTAFSEVMGALKVQINGMNKTQESGSSYLKAMTAIKEKDAETALLVAKNESKKLELEERKVVLEERRFDLECSNRS